jgi:hypothetical protein
LSRLDRHQDNSELLAHGEGIRENFHDLPRSRIGRDIIIRRLALEEKIADASAGEVGLVAVPVQNANDFDGMSFGVGHG